MKTDLLDRLALQLDCNYLSDLKISQNLQKIEHLLRRMDSIDFSIGEWDYVLSYLLGIEVRPQTPSEAADILSQNRKQDNV